MHSTEVEIDYQWDVDTWAVIIKAPSSIEGLAFGVVQINKGNEGNILSAYLRSEKKESHIEAHFYANQEMLNGMFLSIGYGGGCMKGFSVPAPRVRALYAVIS